MATQTESSSDKKDDTPLPPEFEKDDDDVAGPFASRKRKVKYVTVRRQTRRFHNRGGDL